MLRIGRALALKISVSRESWFVALALVAVSVGAFILRYVVLLRYAAPPGADYGNYLTNVHALLGEDVTGGGVQYPLVFVFYLAALVRILGEIPALQFSGPFLASLLGLPMYLFLRRFVERQYAVLGAAMLVFSEGTSEMIGWGGNPTLLGILFGTLFLTFLYDSVAKQTWQARLLAAASFALVAGSHQVSLAFFGFVGISFLVLYLGFYHRLQPFLSGLTAVALGTVGSLPFFPFYLSLSQRGANLLPTVGTLSSVQDVGFIFGWLFREALIVWIPVAGIALLGYAGFRPRDIVGFSLGVALMASPVLLAFTLMAIDPVRAFYYVYLGIIPGALIFVERAISRASSVTRAYKVKIDRSSLGIVVVLGVTLFLVGTAYERVVSATDWYYVADRDVLDGLSWIRSNAPIESVVATNGPMKYGNDQTVGCMWGWWIEGYARRPSLCTANPSALAWREQVLRATDADRAFSGTNVAETGVIRVGDFAPYGTEGNPLIAADFGFGYATLVSFSDAGVTITWQPNQSATEVAVSPSQMPAQSATVTSNQTRADFLYHASAPNVTVQRTVVVSQFSQVIWVNYSMIAIGTLNQIEIRVSGGSQTMFGSNDGATTSIPVSNIPGFRIRIGGTLRLVSATSEVASTEVVEHPASGNPAATFRFAPNGASFSASFEVTAAVDASHMARSLQFYNGAAILDARRVQYSLLDNSDVRHVTWCARDTMHWKEVYANDGVVIFERTTASR